MRGRGRAHGGGRRGGRGGRRRVRPAVALSAREKLEKEGRFYLQPGKVTLELLRDPDASIPWEDVVCVELPVSNVEERRNCPISLERASAALITPDAQVYTGPSILRHLLPDLTSELFGSGDAEGLEKIVAEIVRANLVVGKCPIHGTSLSASSLRLVREPVVAGVGKNQAGVRVEGSKFRVPGVREDFVYRGGKRSGGKGGGGRRKLVRLKLMTEEEKGRRGVGRFMALHEHVASEVRRLFEEEMTHIEQEHRTSRLEIEQSITHLFTCVQACLLDQEEAKKKARSRMRSGSSGSGGVSGGAFPSLGKSTSEGSVDGGVAVSPSLSPSLPPHPPPPTTPLFPAPSSHPHPHPSLPPPSTSTTTPSSSSSSSSSWLRRVEERERAERSRREGLPSAEERERLRERWGWPRGLMESVVHAREWAVGRGEVVEMERAWEVACGVARVVEEGLLRGRGGGGGEAGEEREGEERVDGRWMRKEDVEKVWFEGDDRARPRYCLDVSGLGCVKEALKEGYFNPSGEKGGGEEEEGMVWVPGELEVSVLSEARGNVTSGTRSVIPASRYWPLQAVFTLLCVDLRPLIPASFWSSPPASIASLISDAKGAVRWRSEVLREEERREEREEREEKRKKREEEEEVKRRKWEHHVMQIASTSHGKEVGEESDGGGGEEGEAAAKTPSFPSFTPTPTPTSTSTSTSTSPMIQGAWGRKVPVTTLGGGAGAEIPLEQAKSKRKGRRKKRK